MQTCIRLRANIWLVSRCWSLDDYQFIPFMWGSAQLIDHPTLSPSSIHDERAVHLEPETRNRTFNPEIRKSAI